MTDQPWSDIFWFVLALAVLWACLSALETWLDRRGQR